MRHAVDATHPASWVWVSLMTWCPSFPFSPLPSWLGRSVQLQSTLDMEDYDVRSAASILASVKEQEARFEQLTRALEEERRNVTMQLERANLPPNPPTSQPLAWQQVVMQVNDAKPPSSFSTTNLRQPHVCLRLWSDICLSCFLLPSEQAHFIVMLPHGHCFSSLVGLSNLFVQFLCDLRHLFPLSEPAVLGVVQ